MRKLRHHQTGRSNVRLISEAASSSMQSEPLYQQSHQRDYRTRLHNLAENPRTKIFQNQLEKEINSRKEAGQVSHSAREQRDQDRPSVVKGTTESRMKFGKNEDQCKIESGLNMIRLKYGIKNNIHKIFSSFATDRGNITGRELEAFFHSNGIAFSPEELAQVASIFQRTARPGSDLTIVQFMDMINNERHGNVGRMFHLQQSEQSLAADHKNDLMRREAKARKRVLNSLALHYDLIKAAHAGSARPFSGRDLLEKMETEGVPQLILKEMKQTDIIKSYQNQAGQVDVPLLLKHLAMHRTSCNQIDQKRKALIDQQKQLMRADGPAVRLDIKRLEEYRITDFIAKSTELKKNLVKQFKEPALLRMALGQAIKEDGVSEDDLRAFLQKSILQKKAGKGSVTAMLSLIPFNHQNRTSFEGFTKFIFNQNQYQFEAQIPWRTIGHPPLRAQASDDPNFTQNDLRSGLAKLQRLLESKGKNSKQKFSLLDGSADGVISRQQFLELARRNQLLNKAEAAAILHRLDENQKGYLTFTQFSKGLQNLVSNQLDPGPNNSQPNQEYLRRVLSQRSQFRTGGKWNFDPKSVPINYQFRATRFGSTPAHKNTFINFMQGEDCVLQRFDSGPGHREAPVLEEKRRKQGMDQKRLLRLKKHYQLQYENSRANQKQYLKRGNMKNISTLGFNEKD